MLSVVGYGVADSCREALCWLSSDTNKIRCPVRNDAGVEASPSVRDLSSRRAAVFVVEIVPINMPHNNFVAQIGRKMLLNLYSFGQCVAAYYTHSQVYRAEAREIQDALSHLGT